MLAHGGLAVALLDLARSAGAEASVFLDDDIADDVAVAAWFAASEAVTNALKHAGPARIWLSAVTEGACLRVQVTDDGVGGADPGGVRRDAAGRDRPGDRRGIGGGEIPAASGPRKFAADAGAGARIDGKESWNTVRTKSYESCCGSGACRARLQRSTGEY